MTRKDHENSASADICGVVVFAVFIPAPMGPGGVVGAMVALLFFFDADEADLGFLELERFISLGTLRSLSTSDGSIVPWSTYLYFGE
jgi:hypothetical protein